MGELRRKSAARARDTQTAPLFTSDFQRKDAKAQSRKERLSQSVGHAVDAVFDEARTEVDDQSQFEIHEAQVG